MRNRERKRERMSGDDEERKKDDMRARHLIVFLLLLGSESFPLNFSFLLIHHQNQRMTSDDGYTRCFCASILSLMHAMGKRLDRTA